MKKARLILTFECHRNCEMCVNKHKSLIPLRKKIYSFNELKDYAELIITGGEPMLHPERLLNFICTAKKLCNFKKIYLYTTLYHSMMTHILDEIDGVHYTLHHPTDAQDILNFHRFQNIIAMKNGSYRLYIEPKISFPIRIIPNRWSRVEIKPPLPDGKCPLPENEDLLVWKG